MRRTARPPQDVAGSKPNRKGSRRAVWSRSFSDLPQESLRKPSRLANHSPRGVRRDLVSLAPPPKAAAPASNRATPLATRPRKRTLFPTGERLFSLRPIARSQGSGSWRAERFSGVQRAGPGVPTPQGPRSDEQRISYLVDPASSHMLVSKIKPCMSKYRPKQGETANGSLNQLWFIGSYPFLLG